MASAATAAPAPRARTFAALLEEYAAPPKFPPAQDLDGLEDDVATLSHEHALKTHARYRREPAPAPVESLLQEQTPLIAQDKKFAAPSSIPAATEPAPRKSASVTVRLTSAESDQLRARAAEAGLTVSAYLRSCAFEVESLRAQVKEAVARMREAEPRPPKRSWLIRLFRRSPDRA
jgi:hypothetical protein